MKSFILSSTLLLITFLIKAQTPFVQGYFIDNTGNRNEAWIKAVGREITPKSLRYKLTENGSIEKKAIEEVQEFGIEGKKKFKRFLVNIDKSIVTNYEDMDTNPNLTYESETLFLEVLVEGKANLYMYQRGELKCYFFDTDTTDIRQLIYKKYKRVAKNYMGTKMTANYGFRLQLMEEMACNPELLARTQSINYEKGALIRFFEAYSACQNVESTTYKEKQKFGFDFGIHAAVRSGSMEVKRVNPSVSVVSEADFGNKVGFRVGADFSLILPISNRKWRVFASPTFTSFKGESQYDRPEAGVYIQYTALEIPIGVRYMIFLNNQSSALFLNIGGTLRSTSQNSYIVDDAPTITQASRTRTIPIVDGGLYQPFVGIGYRQSNRIGIELRHGFSTGVSTEPSGWSPRFTYTELILGLRVF